MWFLIVLLVIILIIAFKSIKVVRQSEVYIIERLGKFHKVADAGLTIIIPFFDHVRSVVSLKQQTMDVPPQGVITKDNVTITIDTETEKYLHIIAEDNVGNITSDNIKSLNKTVGNGKDSYGNTINRNLLETIEQLVLWNYTNNKSSDNFDTLVNAGLSGSNLSAGDQNTCKYVYYALKYLANKNSNYTSNGTKKDVVTLDSSKAKIDLDKKQVQYLYKLMCY